MDFEFDGLRRYPDAEAPNLFAVDASDRLILDEAREAIAAAPDRVVVIGDRYGALTLGAAAHHGAHGIRVHQDPLVGELALGHNAATFDLADRFEHHPLGVALLSGACTVLLQLPKSLSQLDEIAGLIAAHAAPDVTVFAGGRIKHLTPAMNDVLARHFTEVSATLARQKSRVLVARAPRTDGEATTYPQREFNDELGLWVAAHGGVFSGPRLDIGTRTLLAHLAEMKPDARTIVDLGCGTGILAAAIARGRPQAAVLATDQSAAAVASARATMEANELSVTVTRDLGLASQPDDCADLVLLNPPFHTGSEVHAGLALTLFDDAARVLKPGGELWTVFNSHLAYRAALTRSVGPTRLVSQNAKFSVTVSTFGAGTSTPRGPRRSDSTSGMG